MDYQGSTAQLHALSDLKVNTSSELNAFLELLYNS